MLNRIPKENKACRECLDMDHEFVRPKFELILLVEDKIGDTTELMLRGEVRLCHTIHLNYIKANGRSRVTFCKELT